MLFFLFKQFGVGAYCPTCNNMIYENKAITSAIKSKAITSALTTYALCLKHNILHILTVLTQFGIHCQYNNSIIKQNYRYKQFPIQFWPSCIARRTFSLRPEEAHSSEQKLVFQLKKIFCFKRKSLLHYIKQNEKHP